MNNAPAMRNQTVESFMLRSRKLFFRRGDQRLVVDVMVIFGAKRIPYALAAQHVLKSKRERVEWSPGARGSVRDGSIRIALLMLIRNGAGVVVAQREVDRPPLPGRYPEAGAVHQVTGPRVSLAPVRIVE